MSKKKIEKIIKPSYINIITYQKKWLLLKSGYKYVKETFEEHDKSFQSSNWKRGVEYRKGRSVQRINRPTKIYRARELGYKAKQGYIVVRSKIRKGGAHKIRPKRGRKPRAGQM